MKTIALRSGFLAHLAVLLVALCGTAPAQTTSATSQTAPVSSAEAAIPAAELLQPKELEQLLRSSSAKRPVILQVGSQVLYREAHIPGSEYAGAAGQEAGLQALQDRVKGLQRGAFIVKWGSSLSTVTPTGCVLRWTSLPATAGSGMAL